MTQPRENSDVSPCRGVTKNMGLCLHASCTYFCLFYIYHCFITKDTLVVSVSSSNPESTLWLSSLLIGYTPNLLPALIWLSFNIWVILVIKRIDQRLGRILVNFSCTPLLCHFVEWYIAYRLLRNFFGRDRNSTYFLVGLAFCLRLSRLLGYNDGALWVSRGIFLRLGGTRINSSYISFLLKFGVKHFKEEDYCGWNNPKDQHDKWWWSMVNWKRFVWPQVFSDPINISEISSIIFWSFYVFFKLVINSAV